jgi:hypothetical protein
VTGAVAGAIFLAFLVLGVMWRNGWLCGKAAADKGIGISFGLLIKGNKIQQVFLESWINKFNPQFSLHFPLKIFCDFPKCSPYIFL